MIELDFRNIIVLLSLAIHAMLLALLYRYGRTTAGGKAYSVAILAIAGWVLPMIFYRAHLFGEVVIWARLLYIMASFTSTSFFVFALVFPNDRKISWQLQWFLFIENLGIILLCLHPTWLIERVELVDRGEDIIRFGPLYPVYASHISGFLTAGFIILFLHLRRASGFVRKQIMYILTGYMIAASLAMATNLILPWFGYFELNWIGQFFSTVIAAFTTYAILRHHLLNIQIIATEGFLILLNGSLILRFATSESTREFVANSVLALAVLLISVLLLRSVKKEVQQREEVTRLAESLERANAQLRSLDQLKTEFLSLATHQMRTPMSVIKGYIGLLLDGAYGICGAESKKVFRAIGNANERLITLIDEFLNISRIEQGRIRYSYAPVDVVDVRTKVVEELRTKAEDKRIVVTVDPISHGLPSVEADPDKVRHLMFNLLDNAIRYTPSGGQITATLRARDRGVEYTVRDTGVGFAQDDAARFFEKFYRGTNVRSTHVDGTGLGLFMAKKFIEHHGGRIWGRSEGIGKGSEFGFWMPLHPPPSAVGEPAQSGV